MHIRAQFAQRPARRLRVGRLIPAEHAATVGRQETVFPVDVMQVEAASCILDHARQILDFDWRIPRPKIEHIGHEYVSCRITMKAVTRASYYSEGSRSAGRKLVQIVCRSAICHG